MNSNAIRPLQIISIVFIYVSAIHAVDGRGIQSGGATHKCPSYCGANNRQMTLTCLDNQFCCGNETFRTCCFNASQDISNTYEDVCGCPQSSCSNSVYVSWPALFGVFALVLTMLLLAICCCQCFIRYSCPCTNTQRDNTARMTLANNRRSRTARVGSIQIATVSINENETQPPPSGQQVIFTPPDYETIYKDLPKYEDLISSANMYSSSQPGHVNSAFTPDAEGQNNLTNTSGVSRESVSWSEDSHSIGVPPRADQDSYSDILPPPPDDDSLSTHSDSLPPPYLP